MLFFGDGPKRDERTNAEGGKRGHHHTDGKLFSKVRWAKGQVQVQGAHLTPPLPLVPLTHPEAA